MICESYLEPLLSTTVAALEVACALVHPDHDRPLRMGPLLPLGLDLTTSSHLSAEIRRCSTVAHDLIICDGHRGVVIGPLALDGLGR
jgi:hypothetical protein